MSNSQAEVPTNLSAAGVRWYKNGQSALSGAALELFHSLERRFLEWAREWQAVEYYFPAFLPAAELAKLDYFHSFPHLATFPVALDSSEGNLKRFTEGQPIDPNGTMHLTELDPVRDVLTPAACYHFYVNFQGQTLEAPRYVTTRSTCFRREAYYHPLERQWSFSMREIVCLGTAEEVKAFLGDFQQRLDQFFKDIRLPIEWKNATDPFFNPSKNPKYVLQKLDPVKTEMIFDDRLAIGSINFHRNYFGETFRIHRDGQDTFSGCVAFGLERWLAAWFEQFGTEARRWPDLRTSAHG